MEYIHGERVTLRYDEMSPLDRMIDSYGRQAEKYFCDLNSSENAPLDVREKRKKDLELARLHLEQERRFAEVIADVQAGLEIYRQAGREATQGTASMVAMKQKELISEKHHSTQILEMHMRAVPIPKPSAKHTAHHIAPGSGRTRDAYRARLRIHRFGVRVNDPDNGVWLPTYSKHTPHWSMPDAKGHLQYHTEGYESWILRKLQAKSSEVLIRQELRLIGQALQENNIPPEARCKK
ncbi:MAG: AHH domain-containing protein [Pseudomonadota bacterium]